MNVLLLSTATSEPFARRLAAALGVALTLPERQAFPDGERYLRFPIADRFDLVGKTVVLVGATDSLASIDELYRLACAAVKYGARVVLVIPYFGYSTMERATKPGEVVTAKTIARQLSAIPHGVTVLLMDLHAAGIVHYFEGDALALELSADGVLTEAIGRWGLGNVCLASTDMGRAKAVEKFANRFSAPVALIHKRRLSGAETRIAAVVGDVAGRDVVIYDDMIRSGSSLIQAATAYRSAGARSVRAVTTHLVLPPGAVEALEAAPLDAVLGTDTHPNHTAVERRGKFAVVSVAPLFADVVRRLG
jgi:ribose-phosphate pyrophosphokinase